MDHLQIDVIEPWVFKSKYTAKMLNAENDNLLKNIPPQITEEEGEWIDQITHYVGWLIFGVFIFNFLITLIMGTSMQPLWGMVRTLQYIVFCFLIIVPTPGYTFRFFKGISKFAQMDIF